MTQRIFVSHSSKDQPLVDAFVDKILRLGCGVSIDEIYCSSAPSMKTRPGRDWIDDLRHKLQGAEIIILILSDNYYDSVYCLAELGASWVLENVETYPIVVPPLAVDNIPGVIRELQVGMINEHEHLDTLRETLSRVLSVPIRNLPDWSKQSAMFVDACETILEALEHPHYVSPEALQRANEISNAYKAQAEKRQNEIDRLNHVIDSLKELKDREEVSSVLLENMDEYSTFKQLVNNAWEAMRSLPDPVKQALYFADQGTHLQIERYESSQPAQSAADEGYLRLDAERCYWPNSEDPAVDAAEQAIGKLARFFESTSNEFGDRFLAEHEFAPSLTNKRFWRRFLW